MLKYILLFALSGFALFSADAQFLIGIKAGTNYSQVFYKQVGQRPPVQSYKIGYAGGVAVKYFAKPHAGIQAEVNYGQKGWLITENGNTYERTLDYVEVPVLSNLYLGKKRMQVFVNLGPYLAFLVGESEKQTIANPEAEPYIFSGRPVTEFDYGIKVGLGFNYAFSFGSLQAEGRFTQGFNKLFSSFGSVEQVQNQVLGVSLAYFYEF